MANYVDESLAKKFICQFCCKLDPDEDCPKDKNDCYYMQELNKSMIYLHSENAPQL